MRLRGALAVSLAVHAALGLVVVRWRTTLLEDPLPEPLPITVVDEPAVATPVPAEPPVAPPGPRRAARFGHASPVGASVRTGPGVAEAKAAAPAPAPGPPPAPAPPAPPPQGGPGSGAAQPEASGMAARGVRTGPGAGGISSSGAPGPDDALRRLEAAVRSRAALDYPKVARRRGLEGTVELRFRVRGDGRVTGLEVLRSAGPVLDQAARAAVEAAAPLPYYPGAVTLPLRYRLRPAD